MFELVWPYALLLLPLPFLIERFITPVKHKISQALAVPFFSGVQSLVKETPSLQRQSRLALWLMWILLVAALSGPQWVGQPVPIKREGRNIILALDLSGSMQSQDMRVNGRPVTRLSVVKETAKQFVYARKGDRIGLIVFGSKAYLQTPLTFDRKTVLHMISDATVGLAGPTTAIGDAIGLAVKRLEKTPPSSRVLVLLTDGANNAGVMIPSDAAKIAKENHIKIYTIGLGADKTVVQTIFGPQIYNSSAELDEKELKHIAKVTGGQFFRARSYQQLENVYQTISKLEPVANKADIFRPIDAYYYVPLLLAFLVFLYLSASRFFHLATFYRRAEHG